MKAINIAKRTPMGGRGKTDLDNYENAVLEMPPRSNSVMNLMDNNNLNASIQH